MIFAKALCVVLLLYSVSFGDSLRLKNDTDLEKRTVINLPPAPHFEHNPNDLVLRTKKLVTNGGPAQENKIPRCQVQPTERKKCGKNGIAKDDCKK
ncbi:Hypothetical predicted protein, partial [Paramuricea clavata]